MLDSVLMESMMERVIGHDDDLFMHKDDSNLPLHPPSVDTAR